MTKTKMLKNVVGTQSMAKAVFKNHCLDKPDYDTFPVMGSGVDRIAYLAPDGVIYKVCHGYDYDANLNEALGYAILSVLNHPKYKVPLTEAHRVRESSGKYIYIIAQENMSHGEWTNEIYGSNEARSFYKNSDLHSGNVCKVDDAFYMIDLGFFDLKYSND
jgi:hypothetical protein